MYLSVSAPLAAVVGLLFLSYQWALAGGPATRFRELIATAELPTDLSFPPRPGFPAGGSRLSRRIIPSQGVAEADGNRTRQRRSAALTGFEDRGDHQVPRRLRVEPTAANPDSRRQPVQVAGEQRDLTDVLGLGRARRSSAQGRSRTRRAAACRA